jgi:Leucine-rich repeat (LRR) protein
MAASFDRESILEFMAWCDEHGGTVPDTPEAVFALTELTIDGSWSDVEAIPVTLAALTNLTHLTIERRSAGFRAREWPVALDALDHLTHLTVRRFCIKQASTCWASYPKLVHLDLSDNRLASLDDSIGALQNLETLLLEKCQGGNGSSGPGGGAEMVLPAELGSLSSLKELDLSYTVLTSFPDMSGMTSLEVLNLHTVEKLTALPESIGVCTQLRVLDLWNSEVTALPETIVTCTQLETLDLYSNGLEALPEAIGELTQLTNLGVHSNALTSVPASISRCTKLQKLDLSNNGLTSVPDSIGEMTGLTSLNLSGNELSVLPEALGSLTALRVLAVSGNYLGYIPDSYANLRDLKRLKVSRNPLGTLPGWLDGLSRLEHFEAESCELTELPEGLTRLTALTELDVSGNKLTALPEGLGELPLKRLDVATNKLERIPQGCIRRRSKMDLYVRGNPLEDTEKAEGIKLIKACLKRHVPAAMSAVLAGASMEMTVGDCVDLGEDGWSGNWGPPALFWAALIPDGSELVQLMLDCGASVKARWPYDGEWDPEDCYMNTDDARVYVTLRELGEHGHSNNLDIWAKGRKGLKKHKVKVEGGHLHAKPDAASLALILAAAEG